MHTEITTMDSAFKAAAQERYAEMRARGPIHRAAILGGLECWMVVDYTLAKEALTHPALLKDPTPAEAALEKAGITLRQPGSGLGVNMLNADPPDHGRLRRLVGAAFTRSRIEALRPQVTQIAESLADAMADHASIDLVSSFTGPLPIQVISELLGVPDENREAFRAWTPLALGAPSPEQRQAFVNLNQLLIEVIEHKRGAAADDLLSALIGVSSHEDGTLSEAELQGTAAVLIVAGHDTTVNLLGNSMVALLRHPDQAQRLRDQPELLSGAVEEFLRYDPSVEYTPMRYAAEDLTLGGVRIPRGAVVVVSLTSASRSVPGMTENESGLLNIERENSRHLAFGYGMHYCLGAPLARLEVEIGIGTLLRRFPDLRPAQSLTDIAWLPAGLMRGPVSLSVDLASTRPPAEAGIFA